MLRQNTNIKAKIEQRLAIFALIVGLKSAFRQYFFVFKMDCGSSFSRLLASHKPSALHKD
jgi:hypothetical protein